MSWDSQVNILKSSARLLRFATTLRSMVYLKTGQGAQAAAEARKILDHLGQGPLSTLWPLVHLTLARASAIHGDTAFVTLWKDADPDIPILIEAKREFEKLK